MIAELMGAIAAAARTGAPAVLGAVLDSDMAGAARGIRSSGLGPASLLGPDQAALVAAVVRGDAALVRLLARRRAAAHGGGPQPRTLAAMRGWAVGFMPLAFGLPGAQQDDALGIMLAALRLACWGGGARGGDGCGGRGGGSGGDAAGSSGGGGGSRGGGGLLGNVLVPRALAPSEFADVVFALGRGWPEDGLLLDMVVSAALPAMELAGDPEALAPLLCRVGRAGQLPMFARRVRASTVERFHLCGIFWPVSADLVAALAAWIARAEMVGVEGSEADEASDDSTGDDGDDEEEEEDEEEEADEDEDEEEEEEEDREGGECVMRGEEGPSGG
jgi:hypothetical protein